MDTLRKKYDLVASLGGNCSAAFQIKCRGQRRCALPFDWISMDDVRPLEYFPKGLATRFEDLFLQENLRQYDDHNPHVEHRRATYRYADALTGFNTFHHFHRPCEVAEEYAAFRALMKKRVDRFYDKISRSKNVLLVLQTEFPYETKLAKGVYDALAKTFPNVEIEMRCLQMSAPAESEESLADGHLQICRYTRAYCYYDLQFTSVEWKFLDWLEVGGVPKRQFKGLDKLKYKIWKWLAPQLEDWGCLSIRFR